MATKGNGKNSTNTAFASAVVGLVALTFLLSIFISPYADGLGVDREVFRYVGMVWHEGGLPYRDVFDHKPPFIYLIANVFAPFGPWSFYVAGASFVSAAAVWLAAVLRRSGFQYYALPSLAFVLLMRFGPIIEGGGLTREYTACFILLFICSVLAHSGFVGLVAQGVLFGMVFLTQQNEILCLLPLSFLSIWRASLGHDFKFLVAKGLRACLTFIAGLAIPLLVWYSYAEGHGVWQAFVEEAFVFNTKYYISSKSLGTKVGETLAKLFSVRLASIVALFGLATALLFGQIPKFWRLFLVYLWASMAFALAGIALSGMHYGHYFLTLVPFLAVAIVPLLLGFGALATGVAHIAISGKIVPHLPLLLVLALVQPALEPERIEKIGRKRQGYPNFAEYEALDKVAGKRGQIYVFRNPSLLALNTDRKVLAPSKYIFTHMWDMYPTWDADGKEFRGILSSLDAANTQYIVDFSSTIPIREPQQTQWNTYVLAHYDTLSTLNAPKRHYLLVRKK